METWKESGLSQTAFAEREAVNLGTFKWWAYRLGHGSRGAAERESAKTIAEEAATFVPVRVRASARSLARKSARSPVASQSASSGIEIVLANGRRVRCDLAHAEDPRLAALLTLADAVRVC